jgi:CBS domain-containing protein
MLTDRDIVVRCLAQGKDGQTKVRDVMSAEVKYCFEDEDIDHVAQNMGDLQIRRLPVVDRDKRLTGILSLGDIATPETKECASDALCKISEDADERTGLSPHGSH